MNQYIIAGIGILAQLFFSARLLIQWICSEKAKRVLSPAIFWQLSMGGSFLLCTYGWLRNDFSIILGQLISYYIYIWNLNIKGVWNEILPLMKYILLYLPVAAIIYFLSQWDETCNHLFEQKNIPMWLVVFGSIGQLMFILRFVYQWGASRKAGESVLPLPFWIISLAGSAMIISYAIIRIDWVLILGQSTGFIIYIRNIIILKKSVA